MKKFFNYAPALLAVAIILGLTSCLTNNPFDPYKNGEKTAILLQITQPDISDTRAISAGIADGTPVNFLTGDIYLVTPGGIIVEHFSIVNSGGATPNASREIPATASAINRSDLEHALGVRITGVSPGVRYGGEIVVVGNTVNNLTTGAISDVRGRTISMLHQGQAHLNSLNLFGRAPLVHQSTNAQGIHTYHPASVGGAPLGTVRLRPTIARLEISNIMGMGYIEAFRVEGVFIDRFYRNARIDGAIPTGATLVNNVAAGAAAFYFNTAAYPLTYHGITFDWNTTSTPWNSVATPNAGGLGFSLPVVSPPGAGNVWSYHLFANDNTIMPRIVFRLSHIVLRDGAPSALNDLTTGSHFVSFNNFVLEGSHTGLNAGYVFRIPPYKLAFSHYQVQSVPSATLSTRAVPLLVIE